MTDQISPQNTLKSPSWIQKLVLSYELCEPEITAQFLKNRVSPSNLKKFIKELRTIAFDTGKDPPSLTKKEASQFLLQCIDLYQSESWFKAGVDRIVAGPAAPKTSL